ncbi:MAG: hypothetical protein IIC99_08340, partial [Chloroflexi bacterium]|nr:hypothetical protein [Chloroflexota bacterium]
SAYTIGGGLASFLWRVYSVNACVGDECSRLGLPASNRPRAMAVGDELTSYTNPAWSLDGSQLAVSQLGGALFIAVQKIKVMNLQPTKYERLYHLSLKTS